MQSEKLAGFRLAGYLTFVDSGIIRPDVADVQRPRVRSGQVQRLEPVVADESVSFHCQQVTVRFADPRHLFNNWEIFNQLKLNFE